MRPSSEAVTSDGATVHLARDVVDFTRSRTRRYKRARSSIRDLFIDAYSLTLAGGCVLMLAASLVVALRNEIAGRNLGAVSLTAARWQVLPAEFLWMFLTYLALAGIALTARRLGPVTVSRAEGAWWLPLPVDRRPMVLPSFRSRLVASGAAASVAYVPFSALTAIDRSAWAHASSAATFGLGAVLAVSSAAIMQLTPASSGAHRVAIFTGLVPVAVLPFLAPAVWPLVLALIAAVILVAYVLPRLGDVSGAELLRGGAVSGHAAASIFFIDVNELRRALAAEPRPVISRRGWRFYGRPTRWASAAVVRADIVAFLRLQPAPTVPLAWLAICLSVALITPALPVLLHLTVILIAGCLTTAGTGTVARRTTVITGLDSLLPVSPALVRCSRMLMPALSIAAWMGLLTSALVALGSTPPSLIFLGVIAGAGMGAGAVRAATRPATDWTTPPVETPFGPVPRDQMSSLLRGTDMTVLAMLPVLLALFLGSVHPWLILTQCIVTAAAVIAQALTSHDR
jgi:hypothetical protein